MSTTPPQHTAEEMAAWLREQIAHDLKMAADTRERRQRVNEKWSDRIDNEGSEHNRRRLVEQQAHQNQRLLQEEERWDTGASDYRRALQWLTGEVW